LNTRQDWEETLGKEKDQAKQRKIEIQKERTRELANKFRIAESIRQDKKNLK
jgi:hypothetical protein